MKKLISTMLLFIATAAMAQTQKPDPTIEMLDRLNFRPSSTKPGKVPMKAEVDRRRPAGTQIARRAQATQAASALPRTAGKERFRARTQP